MSIIERALGKLQGSQPRPSAGPVTRTALRTASLERTAEHGSRADRRPPPKESIEANLDALRAEGMLPPTEFADALTDQFRRVKWPILESAVGRTETGEDKPANLVMVTSSVAAEGKTFTSWNLALSIAREKDFSVLLVDADVAKQHVTRLVKLEERPGLNDLLADGSIDPESLVLGTNIPGLAILPAGRRSSTAPELFASERMIEVVRKLGDYDPRRIVLFDSSPLLATNESQVLGRVVDQVVLVVRAEYTTQPTVLEALSLLDPTKQIRCILNQARASRMTEYYYTSGYYSHEK